MWSVNEKPKYRDFREMRRGRNCWAPATLFLSALMIYAIWVQNDLSSQIEEAQVREAEAAKLIQDYQLQLSNIEDDKNSISMMLSEAQKKVLKKEEMIVDLKDLEKAYKAKQESAFREEAEMHKEALVKKENEFAEEKLNEKALEEQLEKIQSEVTEAIKNKAAEMEENAKTFQNTIATLEAELKTLKEQIAENAVKIEKPTEILTDSTKELEKTGKTKVVTGQVEIGKPRKTTSETIPESEVKSDETSEDNNQISEELPFSNEENEDDKENESNLSSTSTTPTTQSTTTEKAPYKEEYSDDDESQNDTEEE